MESLFKDDMLKHLRQNNLITPHQHGFLSRKSTLSNLISTLNNWFKARVDRKNVHAVYTDFSKAFDTVSHPKLIHKIKSYGFKGEVLEWLIAFLSNRSQFVDVKGSESRYCPVLSGVPQGTVLGPLLFLIYINDLPEVLKYSQISLYADDAKIFRSEKPEIISSQLLQDDLSSFHRWSDEWQLTLAVRKCSVIIFGSPVESVEYKLGVETLEVVNDVNDLGITVSKNQKFSVHCRKTAAKCHIRTSNIFRSFKCRKISFLTNMFTKFVRPSLEYAVQSWSPYLLKDIDTIESVQRRFTKRIPGLKNLSYTQRLEALSLESLEIRRIKSDLLLTYKIVHKKIDLNFDDFFSFAPALGTRGHRMKLEIPRAHTDIIKNYFSFRVYTKNLEFFAI